MVDVTAIPDNNLTQSYLVDRPIVSFGLSVYAFAITDTPAQSPDPALIYTKSIDGGKTFGSPIVLATATPGGGVNGAAIYYDRWTRGITGTKIHIVFPRQNSSGVFYTSIETLTDLQGPFVTLFSGVASSAVSRRTCSICVTPGGNILAAWVLPVDIGNQGMSRSTNGGVSFSGRISPWNADSPAAAVDDVLVITPANTADPNDADIYFFDESGQTVVLRQYRDATNTLEADVSIDASVAIANPDTPFMHACHDHADGTTILGLRDGPINVMHDFTIRRINGGASIVSLPNAYTAQTNRMGTGLCIDNQTGDIYAAYNDSITPFSVQRNFIVKLPFGAGSFDAPIQNSTTDRDYNDIWLPTSIGDAGGAVLGLTHEQAGTQIHYVNPDNSPVISDTSPPPLPPTPSQASGGSFNRLLSGGGGGFMTYITPDGRLIPLHTPHDFGRWTISFSGFGTPPIQYITQRGPFQHGETVKDFFLRPRVIQLLIRQGFANRTRWWAGRAALLDEIRPNRQATATAAVPGQLRVVQTDGTTRDLNVFISEGPRFEPRVSNQWDEFAFQEVLRFIAHDPVAFDPTQIIATVMLALASDLVFPITFPITFGSGLVDSTLNISYLGTWLELPIITIVGPLEDVRIDNTTTGEKIELSADIAPGRTVTIDLREGFKTVVDDLGNNLIGIVTSDSDLATFHLAPDPEAANGVNAIRVRGTNPTGSTSVSLAYFNRYFGF